ncbi:bifunctional RNase H/acid phosphatase, partial [Streptomyces sp. NPDC006356]
MREFIVEADGGSRGNPGPAGYGAVVIDAATGQTLAEAAEYIGVATNNVAEYRGLVAGLRAAYDLDPAATIHVRMDSKLVIEQMSGRWKIKHPDMKPLAFEAARVFAAPQVTYEWIPREQNKHADRLANEAMDAGKRGERWSAAASTAELEAADARAARAAAEREPEPSGPPGDAAAGAARARAALSEGRAAGAAASAGSSSRRGAAGSPGGGAVKADADVRAARSVAAPSSGWAPADMGAPATFVLLRHGETPLTPQKRFSGSGGTDPALSDVGRDQAERAGAALARRGTIQAIVASPLARTRETAAIVAAHLGLEVTVDDGLRETDFGAWEGLTFGEV